MTATNEQMKQGLRRFAKSVSVISSEYEGHRYAIAATAVSEISLEPPTMLVCVNASASISAALEAGAPFTINMLSANQEAVAKACGGELAGADRFDLDGWEKNENGFWYLADAQVSFMCCLRQKEHIGTHTVFMGDVKSVRMTGDIDPLIYFDKSYARGVRFSS